MRISDWSSDVCSSDLLHLLPDRKRTLLAARLPGLNALLGKGPLQPVGDAVDQFAAFVAQLLEAGNDRSAGIAVEFGEGEVFQLLLQVLHADAVGQRDIDLHGLLGEDRKSTRLNSSH